MPSKYSIVHSCVFTFYYVPVKGIFSIEGKLQNSQWQSEISTQENKWRQLRSKSA